MRKVFWFDGLSTRAGNLLREYGVDSLEALMKLDHTTLRTIPGLGKQIEAEILAWLEQRRIERENRDIQAAIDLLKAKGYVVGKPV